MKRLGRYGTPAIDPGSDDTTWPFINFFLEPIAWARKISRYGTRVFSFYPTLWFFLVPHIRFWVYHIEPFGYHVLSSGSDEPLWILGGTGHNPLLMSMLSHQILYLLLPSAHWFVTAANHTYLMPGRTGRIRWVRRASFPFYHLKGTTHLQELDLPYIDTWGMNHLLSRDCYEPLS